jgi:integrase
MRSWSDASNCIAVYFRRDGSRLQDGKRRRQESSVGQVLSGGNHVNRDEASWIVVDFSKLGLITGCRYMELCHMKASAYDASNKAISLIQGKTRKVKHVFRTDDEAAFFDAHTKGKAEDALIFTQLKADEKTGEVTAEPWKKSNQQPRMKAVLKAANIKRHIRFLDLRHTFATLLVKNGTSIQLVANQFGHSTTRWPARSFEPA